MGSLDPEGGLILFPSLFLNIASQQLRSTPPPIPRGPKDAWHSFSTAYACILTSGVDPFVQARVSRCSWGAFVDTVADERRERIAVPDHEVTRTGSRELRDS